MSVQFLWLGAILLAISWTNAKPHIHPSPKYIQLLPPGVGKWQLMCSNACNVTWYMVKGNSTVPEKAKSTFKSVSNGTYRTVTVEQSTNEFRNVTYYCVVETQTDITLSSLEVLSRKKIKLDRINVQLWGDAVAVPYNCSVNFQKNDDNIYQIQTLDDHTVNDSVEVVSKYSSVYTKYNICVRVYENNACPKIESATRFLREVHIVEVIYEYKGNPNRSIEIKWTCDNNEIDENNETYEQWSLSITLDKYMAILVIADRSNGCENVRVSLLAENCTAVTSRWITPYRNESNKAKTTIGGTEATTMSKASRRTEVPTIRAQVGEVAHTSFEFEYIETDWPILLCEWLELPADASFVVSAERLQKEQCHLGDQSAVHTCIERNGRLNAVQVSWLPQRSGLIECRVLNEGDNLNLVMMQEVRLLDQMQTVPATSQTEPATSQTVLTCRVDKYTYEDVQLLRNGDVLPVQGDDRVSILHTETEYTDVYELQVAENKETDVYECVVRARIRDGGVGELTVLYQWEVVPVGQHWEVIATIVAGVMVLLTGGGVRVYMKGRQRGLRRAAITYFADGDMQQCKPDRPSHEQAHLWPYDRSVEFPLERLRVSNRRLGAGTFGIVYRAKAYGIGASKPTTTTVAVKMAKRDASDVAVRSLIAELKIMARITEHANVLRLLGAVTAQIRQRKLYVITEFCELGNLQVFLRGQFDGFVDQLSDGAERIVAGASSRLSARGDIIVQTSSTDLLCWSLQAARGMAHLVACGILHGDVAARNCLLNGQRQLKIADFGLSRQLRTDEDYQKQSDDPLPIKWMAIESIRDNCFNTATDVWSFGVLLWELFSLGDAPYAGMPNVLLVGRLLLGHRMARPLYATVALHELMCDCWRAKPQERPDFGRIERRLAEMLPLELRRIPADGLDRTYTVRSRTRNAVEMETLM